MSDTQLTPEVTWAQRSSSTDAARNYLYVNIKTPDVPKSTADLKITSSNVTFAGTTTKGTKYHVSLDLFGDIDPENSKVNHTDRELELVLRKKELKDEYWPRLLKTDKKAHFLKTDFDKWVDEDEQDEALDEDYANNFGGFGEEGGLGNIDFSKLGGLDASSQAGGEGAEDMPELEETPETDAGKGNEDEDMPELETVDESATATS